MKVSKNLDRQWKPGDVAMVDSGNGFRPARVGQLMSDGNLVWRFLDTNTWVPLGSNVRPLVVIDLDAASKFADADEAVRCMVESLRASDYNSDTVIADQIEQQWNPKPPKPEEPTGLGAVVEDARGALFVRADNDAHRWAHVGIGSRTVYEHIDAVRVLSEGVEVESR